jgi:sugar lactone lactonase YvrE
VKIASAFLLAAFALLGQDAAPYQVSRIAAELTFAEGPVWSREGYLIFSDIPNNRQWRWRPGAKAEVFRENSDGANGSTLDSHGRLYICEGHTRRVVRIDSNGKTEVLADNWQGKKLNEPNDIVVRHDGHVWFTDPAFGSADQRRELDFYGVFHISPKGVVEVVAKPKGRPNGIALSPDGHTLYVDNSDERNVRAYDVDRNGAASNGRVVVSNIEGVPDGMKVDENGNLYVAAKAIFVYSVDGHLMRTIPVPETPSNCAFGDADWQSLFVTARTSVYRIRLDVKGAVQY